MPEKATMRRAQRDKRQGKSASTQAGEFVREEMDHIREGKHGARSAKQAIAIGLSKARDKAEEEKAGRKPSSTRSQATRKALKKEGKSAASHTALSRQARKAAAKRSAASRSRAAKKAAATRKRNA